MILESGRSQLSSYGQDDTVGHERTAGPLHRKGRASLARIDYYLASLISIDAMCRLSVECLSRTLRSNARRAPF